MCANKKRRQAMHGQHPGAIYPPTSISCSRTRQCSFSMSASLPMEPRSLPARADRAAADAATGGCGRMEAAGVAASAVGRVRHAD